MRAAGSLGRNASARRLTRDKTLLCLPPTRNKMVSARHSHDNESLFVPVPPTEEKQLFGPAPTRKKKRSQCFVQAPGTRTHGRKKKKPFFAPAPTRNRMLWTHTEREHLWCLRHYTKTPRSCTWRDPPQMLDARRLVLGACSHTQKQKPLFGFVDDNMC